MARIGVMVVDDSVVIRRMVTGVLALDPEIDVVGTAANGRLALDRLPQVNPDIVILDVEMPVMDGLQTLRCIRAKYPTLPVVMFSTLTERGATATLDALAAGASDYVTKPSHLGSISESIARVRGELVPTVKALVKAARDRMAPSAPPVVPPVKPVRQERVDVLAVGCSTGGPDALAALVAKLPRDFPVPVLVVQHMPPLFTRLFAERLDRNCPLTVHEAADGQLVEPGNILVAPGDHHLTVRRQGGTVRVVLTDDPPENYCRPAVDVLFRSVATTYGAGTLACVLTGMGRDGAKGAEQVYAQHGRIVVQDQASSVVWGMPGAVAAAGLASDIVPLDRMAETLATAVAPRRRAVPPATSAVAEPAVGSRPAPDDVPAVTRLAIASRQPVASDQAVAGRVAHGGLR